MDKERSGWAAQKPLALCRRIIKASSRPGNIALDPFCGCTTTLIAAEQLDRQWIGFGLSPQAEETLLREFQDHGAETWCSANVNVRKDSEGKAGAEIGGSIERPSTQPT